MSERDIKDLISAGFQQEKHIRPNDTRRPMRVPTSIAEYKILRELAAGGMGVVYEAEQARPLRRVALKVLPMGFCASATHRQLFEREVAILARLKNPSIVHIYDSGETAEGQLFYTMEFIDGQPIVRYCYDYCLTVEERLKLLAATCNAVQFAHHHGVIHRDLKPANILVDDSLTPHVLDFGLARLADSSGNGRSLLADCSFFGSAGYASPEQWAPSDSEVDSRTDVFSLGVIAYELLTGEMPFRTAETPHAAGRPLHTEVPPAPSQINGHRKNDLDNVISMALALEKDRRYQTPAALAEDIHNFLEGRPVIAVPPTRRYRAKKWITLHWQALSVTLLIAVTFGAAAFAWGAIKRSQSTEIMAEGVPLLEGRVLPDYGREKFQRAIRVWSRNAIAWLYMGKAMTILGLEAPILDKNSHGDEALLALREAEIAAGGIWPASHERRNSNKQIQPRVNRALRMAAKLSYLMGDYPSAQVLLNSAATENSIDRAGVTSSTDHSLEGIYDKNEDALFEPALPLLVGRRTAELRADRDAGIVRGIWSGSIMTLNPIDASGEAASITELLFDGLTTIDANGEYECNRTVVANCDDLLASQNETVITLRSDLKWHGDGAHPIVAADFRFSWEQLPAIKLVKQAIKDIEVVDEQTFIVKHAVPTANPWWDLDFFPLPTHWFEARIREQPGLDMKTIHNSFGRTPIGNGPYELASFPPDGADVVLTRWEEYQGERPHIKTVTFRAMSDGIERATALAEGKLDIIDLRATEFQWLVNGISFDERVVKFSVERHAYDYICWNLNPERTPLFTDPRIRRAIAHAVDLEAISSFLHGGLYRVSHGIFHPNADWAAPNIEPITYNPAEAAVLLDAAGWIVGRDGIRVHDGEELSFEFTVSVDSHETILALELLAGYLKESGIRTELDKVPWNVVQSRQATGDFDAVVGSVINAPYPDSERRRWSSGGELNYGSYVNSDVSDLYQKARLLPEDQELKRREMYAEIQKRIYEDQPYLFLWHRPQLLAVSRRLRDLASGPTGITGFAPGPRGWWVERSPKQKP